jgi:hypothetical protein
MTHGKKACLDAPESVANGQAIKPLTKIKAMDAPVKDKTEMGSNDLADSEMKIKTGSAISTTNLFDPARSGLMRLL